MELDDSSLPWSTELMAAFHRRALADRSPLPPQGESPIKAGGVALTPSQLLQRLSCLRTDDNVSSPPPPSISVSRKQSLPIRQDTPPIVIPRPHQAAASSPDVDLSCRPPYSADDPERQAAPAPAPYAQHRVESPWPAIANQFPASATYGTRPGTAGDSGGPALLPDYRERQDMLNPTGVWNQIRGHQQGQRQQHQPSPYRPPPHNASQPYSTMFVTAADRRLMEENQDDRGNAWNGRRNSRDRYDDMDYGSSSFTGRFPGNDFTNSNDCQQLPPTAGLKKRRFEAPRRAGTAGSTGGGGGNGGSSSGRQLPPEGKNNGSGGESPEKLPPELSHCDADMVERITKEVLQTGDPVTFNDIAGLEGAKELVVELVCWPMSRPELFTGLRQLPRGLLLFGPPGTGKTLIGKAIAYESKATFFSISCSSLMSKWMGEGEKLVRALFAVAAYRQPSIIFIDEVDSMLSARTSDENEASRRLKTEFLIQLDGAGTKSGDRVLVVGATNRPEELDEAARRRFVKRVHIPLPDRKGREQLLRRLLEKNQNSMTADDILEVVNETQGFSGADVRSLCTEAAMGPLRGCNINSVRACDLSPVTMEHFRAALRSMRPSVSEDEVNRYLKWNTEFGSSFNT